MKIEESCRKKQVYKWTKLGVGLLAVSILGGGNTPGGIDLFHVDTVYAQAQESVTAVLTFYDVSDLSEIADRVYIDVKPGESISYTYPVFDGYTLHEDYDSVLILDYDSVARRNGETIATGFRKVEKPAETPTDKPVDTPTETPTEQPPQPITFPVRYVSVDYTADKGAVITGVLYETTATVEPGGTVFIENKTFDGYSLDTMEGPWKAEHSYEDVVAAGWSDGIDLWYSAKTPTIDNTTDTANSSVDIAFQEASTRLYNLLMTASRLNPEDYTAESYNKGYESRISPGLTESIVTILHHYKEVVKGNVKLEDRWDNGASPKAWLTEVYNSDSSVLEQALAGLVPIQQETPSDSSSAGTDEGTTGKTSQTPTDNPVTPPIETPSVESPVTPPADSKTTETNSVTNQLAQNQPAQAGNLSSQDDKKPVSQTTQESPLAQPQAKQASVKPQQETVQQAKSLPATGEAGSILGLAGLGFTGLSGIHYALRPRKRERSTRK
ncbi:hypothetical protein PFZ59_12155 [Streptococcus suis]|uniref:hypothetical protein n=1 Tax=Streptococcus suis TaxID=1307 RepID=UPI00240E1795|nr:hypothetical protein [Streptococcus suis]WFA75866.1 hypothetical protein PFZ59_12155 [Streptococcus suis]